MNIPEIRNDSAGHGYYGAPRGSRTHKGLDFTCEPDFSVYSFSAGRVSKIGYPYSDDLSYRYVEVKTPEGLRFRYFYVEAYNWIELTSDISAGQPIGDCQDIMARYPGDMQNHYHLEIKTPDDEYLNPMPILAGL